MHIAHRFKQLLALLAQALGAVLGGIIIFQQLAVAGKGFLHSAFAILGQGQKAVLHRTAIGSVYRGGHAPLLVNAAHLIQRCTQLLLLGCIHARRRNGRFVAKCAERRLAAHHRPHAAGAFEQRIRHGKLLLHGRRHQTGAAQTEKVRPGRCGGQRVFQARQQLANLAVFKIHTL